jgi:hypothetical protein
MKIHLLPSELRHTQHMSAAKLAVVAGCVATAALSALPLVLDTLLLGR